MQVRMVKMFKQGIEIEKRLLNDRYTQTHRGKLVHYNQSWLCLIDTDPDHS